MERIVRPAVPKVAAAAVALLAVALAGFAVLVLRSEPERAAGLPTALEGEWRLTRHANSLHLLESGSRRCSSLRIDSACYVLEDAERALNWGPLRVSGDVATFEGRDPAAGGHGVYRWDARDAELQLTKVRDEHPFRSKALESGPFSAAGAAEPLSARVPRDWTARRFTSKRHGYSIRYPREWSARAAARPMTPGGLASPASDAVDRFSKDPRGTGLPMVLVAAHAVPDGTAAARWATMLNSHVERSEGCSPTTSRRLDVGGEPATVTVYPYCGPGHTQWATFVRGDQGFQASWWGKAAEHTTDGPRFDAILKGLELSG